MEFKKIKTDYSEKIVASDVKMVMVTFTFPAHNTLSVKDIAAEVRHIIDSELVDMDSHTPEYLAPYVQFETAAVSLEDLEKWEAENNAREEGWVIYAPYNGQETFLSTVIENTREAMLDEVKEVTAEIKEQSKRKKR